jgi:chaperonin GroEL|tara:strand:+ start:38 stop:1663 length:1626 start_codon:yes stop_codon:yes gene_type:complete
MEVRDLKDIIFEQKARESIAKGVDILARAVRVTLGPKGRNVILEKKFGPPVITKDGVTVARDVMVKDPFENLGAQMVKEVASKTCDVAGDGTTTATILAQAIYREGLKYVSSGHSPMAIKRGIEKAVAVVVDELKAMSRPVEDHKEIAQIGTISANNDREIGDMIAEAMDQVGKEGVITAEETSGVHTTLDVSEGMQFYRGALSPYFVTNQEKMECVLENPLILLHERKIRDQRATLEMLKAVKMHGNGRPVLIIAEDIDREALTALVVNKVKGAVMSCAVKAPGFGERMKAIMEDIGIMTGSEPLMDALGKSLEDIDVSTLGGCDKAIIDRDSTILIGGKGDKVKIEKRVAEIRKLIEVADSEYEKEKAQERLAKMVGGVAIINVGGTTETEVKEKAMRVDDAMHATRAAVEEGIVPGGGAALLRCIEKVKELEVPLEEKAGVEIIRKAIEEPARWIARNGGYEGAVIVEKVIESKNGNGFNAETGEFEDLMKAGIIDPTKVTRSALQNASSIASLLLTTDAIIGFIPETLDTKEVQVVT